MEQINNIIVANCALEQTEWETLFYLYYQSSLLLDAFNILQGKNDILRERESKLLHLT